MLLGNYARLYANGTLTYSAVAAANINQEMSNNLIYVAKMVVTTSTVTVSHIQFTLSDTHDRNNLVGTLAYFNATATTFSGLQAHSIAISRAIATGSTGYFLILANVNATASDNKTVNTNGSATSAVFGFTTATNSQTDAAGLRTIHAAGARQAPGSMENPLNLTKSAAVDESAGKPGDADLS